jgi:ABC-type antimicrobial peptide transport system permease subunit
MLLRSSFRHRWRSWLLLSVLVALVSGLVLAAVVAGRDTATAFPRYEAAHGYDAFLYAVKPIPTIAALPEVASSTPVQLPTGGNPTCTCACSRPINNDDFSVFEVAPKDLPHMVKLVAGRMPDQSDPDQVLASVALQQDNGVRVGTVIRVPFAATSQRSAVLNNASLTPSGPTVALHVVGIEVSEIEFPVGTTPSDDLYTTQAFARKVNPRTVVLYSYFVRLHHGSADLPQFETRAKAIGGLSVTDLDNESSAIALSIRPQSVGWWILAGLSALVGIIVVAQALNRQTTTEANTYATLIALGVSGRQLALCNMARTLLIGLVGTIGGVVLAFGLSPLTVVGEVRLADPNTGFTFDTSALLLGGLAAVIVVLALGLWPAIRTARTRDQGGSARVERPSRIVALLSSAGAPPTVLIGVRHALERGRGRNAVPVGSALLGSILAVTALCATTVFGASLTHLTSTPTLYGQAYDEQFAVNQTGYSTQNIQMLDRIQHTRGISTITAGISSSVAIDGRVVGSIAGQSLRGPLLATTINGRLPSDGHEVALGATTLRQLGAHVGSRVQVVGFGRGSKKQPTPFQVVGTVVLSSAATSGGLGTGAVFNLGGLLTSAGRCAPGPKLRACLIKTVIGAGGAFEVRVVPGPQGRAAEATLAREYPSAVSFPAPPTNLVNFGEAVNFPLLFGAILILFGAATLLHVLVVSVVRRRRELGLLKALGFVRRQVAFSVSWQTTTVALVGIVIGVPAGIAIGRSVWQAFANNLGILPASVVLAWVTVAVALGTVLIANLLAIGPAFVASRSRPASLLRAE